MVRESARIDAHSEVQDAIAGPKTADLHVPHQWLQEIVIVLVRAANAGEVPGYGLRLPVSAILQAAQGGADAHLVKVALDALVIEAILQGHSSLPFQIIVIVRIGAEQHVHGPHEELDAALFDNQHLPDLQVLRLTGAEAQFHDLVAENPANVRHDGRP